MARPVAARGETRARVLDAALALFAEHGVSGTSLQMIADEVGVTKAAVYFQFRTKEEIVLALAEPVFEQMGRFLDAAEAERTRRAQLDRALEGLVDLILDHRQVTVLIRSDPAMHEIVRSHEAMDDRVERLTLLLTGPRPGVAAQVAAVMAGGGLMLAGISEELARFPTAVVRRELLSAARRILVPESSVSRRRS